MRGAQRLEQLLSADPQAPFEAEQLLKAWLSWARRCRLAPIKRLAATITERLPGVERGMLDGRSNAYVEAMNGLRMAKLKHLPANPFAPGDEQTVRSPLA